MSFHIAAEKVAPIVLAPGDPLRAKLVAERFLTDSRLITDIRNVLGYIGTYKGKEISVIATGMGGPSIGIYSYELFKVYDVEAIIRIGTCGGLTEKILPGDRILALTASTDSAWAHQYDLKGTSVPPAIRSCSYQRPLSTRALIWAWSSPAISSLPTTPSVKTAGKRGRRWALSVRIWRHTRSMRPPPIPESGLFPFSP